MASPRVLGVFAHPDDEVFCVGGTMAALADQGAETMLLSLTRGEAGTIRDASLATPRTLGEVRAGELERAAAALGVSQVRCYDLGDGTLASLDGGAVDAAIRETISFFRPEIVVTFDEDGAYGHTDHIEVSNRTTELCASLGDDGPDVVLHASFPRNDRLLLDLLSEWLVSLDQRFRGSDDFVQAMRLFADGSSMLGYAADCLQTEWFPAGSYVIEQDAEADCLHLVLSGDVDVVREHDDGTVARIGHAGPGEFIGELGVATGARRSAHCIAASSTTCMVLSPRDARESPLPEPAGVQSVDIRPWLGAKVDALCEHRTQYRLTPGLFPTAMLEELLGTEHFVVAWSRSDAPGPVKSLLFGEPSS